MDGLQFTTPWITLADGKGRYLSKLTLSLTASGDVISAMRWETQYVDEEPPPFVTIGTVWEHAIEDDLATALGVLFFIATALVALLTWCTCAQHGTWTFFDEDGDEQPQRQSAFGYEYNTYHRHQQQRRVKHRLD